MGRNEGIQALSWLLLQTCVIRAWDLSKPLLFCPAMNTAMWEHPITARQVEQLKGFGYTEIPCVVKKLVCGDEGQSFPVAPAPSPAPVLPSSSEGCAAFCCVAVEMLNCHGLYKQAEALPCLIPLH